MDALEILKLNEAEFQSRFQSTPLSRPGWDGLRRNAAIVLGNTGSRDLIPELITCLNNASPLVHEAISWAINKLQSKPA